MSFLPFYRILESIETHSVTVYVCHGILGSGLNWTSFCRHLMRLRPDCRFVLIDHRNHGRSEAGDPPNTVRSCAEDLIALSRHIGAPDIVMGHSFSGKVVLSYAQIAEKRPAQIWSLDSIPSAERGSREAHNLIKDLAKIPLPLAKRSQLAELLQEKGFSLSIARWMTTNLKSTAQGYVWRFDLDGVSSMIDDYFTQEYWSIVESPDSDIHFVRAELSDRWTEACWNRLQASPSHCHILPKAGHWLHVDNPEGLITMLAEKFWRLHES